MHHDPCSGDAFPNHNFRWSGTKFVDLRQQRLDMRGLEMFIESSLFSPVFVKQETAGMNWIDVQIVIQAALFLPGRGDQRYQRIA